MAAQQQQPNYPVIGPIDLNNIHRQFDAWVKSQHPAVEVAVVTLSTALQGGFTGFMFGYLFKEMGNAPPPPGGQPDSFASQLAVLQKGGPWGQARSFAVLMGANTGLTLAIKKLRAGKEDVWGSMGAAFGAGFLYSLVSGVPNPLSAAFSTGVTFAIFNGLIYQVGQAFKPQPEVEYEHGKGLLSHLGLQKYHDNLKKQLLTDSTIMLWNESALTSANIPAGPRLLILRHLDSIRNPALVRSGYLPPAHHHPVAPLPSTVLKPALSVGGPSAAQQQLNGSR